MIFRFWCVQLWKLWKIFPPDHLLLTLAQNDKHVLLRLHVARQPLAQQTQSLPEKPFQSKQAPAQKKSITLLLPEADREVRASPWCCALGQCCWFYSTDFGTCKQSDIFSHNLSFDSHTCSCSPHESDSSYRWQSSSSESHSEKVFHPHRPSHNSGNTNVRQDFIRSQMNSEAKILLDLNCLLPVGEAFVIFLLCLLHLLLLRFHHLPLNVH